MNRQQSEPKWRLGVQRAVDTYEYWVQAADDDDDDVDHNWWCRSEAERSKVKVVRLLVYHLPLSYWEIHFSTVHCWRKLFEFCFEHLNATILHVHLFDDAVRKLCKLVARWPCPAWNQLRIDRAEGASDGGRMVGSHTKPVIGHSSRWPIKIYGRTQDKAAVDYISRREHIVSAIVNERQYARSDEKDERSSCLMLRPS